MTVLIWLVFEILCNGKCGPQVLEAAEPVTFMLSIHISVSGIWIVLCIFWKVLIPLLKYMAEPAFCSGIPEKDSPNSKKDCCIWILVAGFACNNKSTA